MYAVGNVYCSLVWSAGPVKAAHCHADPQQLASIASTLEAAVDAHMKHYTTLHALSPTVPVAQSAPADSAATGNPGAPSALHGLDSTAMAACFGCAAHLLQIHRKLKHSLSAPQQGGEEEAPQGLIPSGPMSSATAIAEQQQQQSQLASSSDHPFAADKLQQRDQAETSDDAGKHGHMGISHDAEVLQHVTRQVEWLTNILKLPWQLLPAGTPMQVGR